MSDLWQGVGRNFFGGIANQIAESLVERDTLAVTIQDQHAYGRTLKDRLEKVRISRQTIR
jgi:hypothetical protein